MRTPVFLSIVGIAILALSCSSNKFSFFISKQGDQLFDGERKFRFISFNIPNLDYLEDYLPFDETNPWRLPNEYEIRDALTSIKHLGGKVARMYVLSVKKENDDPNIIRHVEGPGIFNEEAFAALDKVLQVANEVGVRVIIPFVDNWHWWGGPKEYAAFRGKDRDSFWTDRQLIEDFKKTIEHVINRKNSFTGVLYKDDKAIMAWETGNELAPPFSWTKEIAAFIKSLDKNHLLIEGIISSDISEDAIADTNIDILSTHHYRYTKKNIEKILDNHKRINGAKPYFIGEYGIVPTQEIRAITDSIINLNLTGGLLWSLRFRNRDGGFYNHYEYNNTAAYHWPGFEPGDVYDEKLVLDLVREKAYQIDGKTVPPMPLPDSPKLLEIKNVSEISWQGSTGASSYAIERKEEYVAGWKILDENVDESKIPYRPLFSDESAEIGKRYFYRVKAKNVSGESDYSNIVGPVEVKTKKIVDEFENLNKVFQKDGAFNFLSIELVRKAKEERNRLTGANGSYLIYKILEKPISLKLDFFAVNDSSDVKIFAGNNLDNLLELTVSKKIFTMGMNDYGFYDAARYFTDNIPDETRYIKFVIKNKSQLSRLEIEYK